MLVSVLVATIAGIPRAAAGQEVAAGPALDPPVELVLTESRILGGAEDFAWVPGIGVIDDEYLLVLDDQDTDHHLKVLDIGSGEVMARFGGHGDGPYEFRNPHRVSRDLERSDRWWVYDFDTRDWTPVTMGEDAAAWEIGEPLSLKTAPFSSSETPFWVAENEAVVHGMSVDFSVARVKFDPDRQADAGAAWSPVQSPRPYTEENMPHPVGRELINRNYAAGRPSGGRFALAHQFANWIDVLDGSGRVVRKVEGPREVENKDRIVGDRFYQDDDTEHAYLGAYGTEDGFWLLLAGTPAGGPVSTIHQFDWDGNFVREFAVNRSIRSFAVSSTGDRIWGFLMDGIPYPGIGEWVIP